MDETYLGLGRVLEDCFDASQDFGCELRDDLESFEVVHDLLRTRRPKDDRTGVRLLRDPCEREVANFAVQLCVSGRFVSVCGARREKKRGKKGSGPDIHTLLGKLGELLQLVELLATLLLIEAF